MKYGSQGMSQGANRRVFRVQALSRGYAQAPRYQAMVRRGAMATPSLASYGGVTKRPAAMKKGAGTGGGFVPRPAKLGQSPKASIGTIKSGKVAQVAPVRGSAGKKRRVYRIRRARGAR